MPRPATAQNPATGQNNRAPDSASPAEAALEMVLSLFEGPNANPVAQLEALNELSFERIKFDGPDQATKMISTLANIVTHDKSAKNRHAALEAMERMITLEQKAEAETGKPPINWKKIDILVETARKQLSLEDIPVPSRAGAPSPESGNLAAYDEPVPDETTLSAAVDLNQTIDPNGAEAHPVSRDDGITPEDDALLAAQKKTVRALRQTDAMDSPPIPASVDAQVQPHRDPQQSRPLQKLQTLVAAPEEGTPESSILKFLRSIAGNEEEENIRILADRIVQKFGNTAEAAPAPVTSAPAPTEG